MSTQKNRKPKTESRKLKAKSKKRIANKRGFTLIELLVAITLLAIGILAIAGLMPLGSRSGEQARTLTRGIELAQQRMEYIKTLPYTHVELNKGYHPPAGGAITPTPEQVEKFQRYYRVEDSIPMPNMKRVSVTVKWIAPRSDSVQLRTYIASNK
ncbi:MAG: prepilin-type N-terminal cleavage/methylation domain-containing protein [Candidatus Edwardsbacteria bacterium]